MPEDNKKLHVMCGMYRYRWAGRKYVHAKDKALTYLKIYRIEKNYKCIYILARNYK